MTCLRLYDVPYVNNGEYATVEDGYVFCLSFSKSGTYTVAIEEYDTAENLTGAGQIGTVTVLDYETEETLWQDAVIAACTTDDMTGAEKMTAIAVSLEDGSEYCCLNTTYNYTTEQYENGEIPVLDLSGL